MGTGGSVCIPVGKHDSKASLLGGNSRQKGQQSAFWKALPARPYFTQTYCSLLNLAWLDYYLPAMHVRSIAGRRPIGRNWSTKGLHPLFSCLFAKDKYSPYPSWQSPACLLLNITRSVLALRHGKKNDSKLLVFLIISNARQTLYDTIVKKWHAFQTNLTQQQEQEIASFPSAETEEEKSGPDDCPMYRHHAALYGQEFLVNGRSMEHVWVGNMGWRNWSR